MKLIIKVIIKIIIIIVCLIPCFREIKNLSKSRNTELNEYLQVFEACISSQNEIEKAISNYGNNKSIFENVRSFEEFKSVEKELIEKGCLDKQYNKTLSEDCFFIIVKGEVCCVCHSDINQIKENIKWVESLEKDYKNYEKFDYLQTIVGGIVLISGLFAN